MIEAATETEIKGMLLMSVEMTGVEKTGVEKTGVEKTGVEMTGGTVGWCWYCQIQTAAVAKETVADKMLLSETIIEF